MEIWPKQQNVTLSVSESVSDTLVREKLRFKKLVLFEHFSREKVIIFSFIIDFYGNDSMLFSKCVLFKYSLHIQHIMYVKELQQIISAEMIYPKISLKHAIELKNSRMNN